MKYVYKKPAVVAAVRTYDILGSLFFRRKRARIQGPPGRIVLLLLHQIGDAVLSLPTISAICKSCPAATADIFVGSASEPLIGPSLQGANLHKFDAAWDSTVRHTLGENGAPDTEIALGKRIMELRPDVVVVFHPDIRVNRVLGTAKVPCSIGFANAGGGFWLTDPLEAPIAGHQVNRNFVLAEQFARIYDLKRPTLEPPSLEIDTLARKSAIEKLQSSGTGPGEQIVCIHPFGRFTSRCWSVSKWASVLPWIEARGLRPVIIGGGRDEAKPYLDASKSAVSLVGLLDLPETAALIEHSRLFVGIDSGPGHIASAVSCPVVSVFSAVNDPSRWAPYGDNVEVVYADVVDRERYPLEARDLPFAVEENPYSAGITAQMVIEAIERQLSRD